MEISEQNNNYIQSLASAKIIQQALLPKERHFNRIFKNHFVSYIPQNIISGDFYWVGSKKDLDYLVVGDCIGHSISAALLSVLALNIFEYAIMNKGLKKTNKILKEVDKKFIESFKNTETKISDTPWIELSIICIDNKKNEIYFSSAKRKLMHVDKNEGYKIYKGSNYPIGGWQIETERKFEATKIKFNKGDKIYLGSDGFQDQIGGDKNKKYKSKELHNFLAKHSNLPFCIQKAKVEEEFYKWKKDNDQLDDVCIVGVLLE